MHNYCGQVSINHKANKDLWLKQLLPPSKCFARRVSKNAPWPIPSAAKFDNTKRIFPTVFIFLHSGDTEHKKPWLSTAWCHQCLQHSQALDASTFNPCTSYMQGGGTRSPGPWRKKPSSPEWVCLPHSESFVAIPLQFSLGRLETSFDVYHSVLHIHLPLQWNAVLTQAFLAVSANALSSDYSSMSRGGPATTPWKQSEEDIKTKVQAWL